MYNNCKTDEERNALMHSPYQIGFEASEETIRWIWNNHFAAVAGDACAFEVQPFSTKLSKIEYGEKSLICLHLYSPARLFACLVGNANWRALGLRGASRQV